MRTLFFLLVLVLQASSVAPPASLRATLRLLREQFPDHKATYGATPELATAKHQLRDWVESRLAAQPDTIDTRAFAETLHVALNGANLLCNDFLNDCDGNFLGYVDDVRVSRTDGFLMVVTAMGIRCGFDESAYVYAWEDRQWRRVWEHEVNTYTDQGYLPQVLHDVQVSVPDAGGGHLIMTLGSQSMCGGAFKDVYARAWRLDADHRSTSVLDWKAHANDAYPPIQGRVGPDDVLVQFTAGGLLSGEVHSAVRHFTVDQGTALQVDPVASLPRDFVVEWLTAPWEESRRRSESPALEAQHTELYRSDGVGDFPKPTLRCTGDADMWQVTTHMYEGPTRYYRVRWRPPFSFSVVDIRETPYEDCTLKDSRGETYPNLLQSDLR